MPTDRRVLVADLAVKVVTLGLLALALAVPDWERFSDKAMTGRAVVYPLGLLVVPAAWALARRRARRPLPFPALADLLVSLPWAVDLAGNALDLFDAVVWFDDAAHLVNWGLLTAGTALVLPRSLPTWVRVLLGAGCGCLAALVWEVGEYVTFVRGGPEEATAYADTLGDMVLGTTGALLASVVVAALVARRGRRPRRDPVDRSAVTPADAVPTRTARRRPSVAPMGKIHEAIGDDLAAWMRAQPVYFVATAPLAADGHVNVSPKGMDGTFAVLDGRTVAYLDYSGSGAETIAHLRENGRIVVMFAAFDGRPNIVRLHGRGRVVLPAEDEFARLRVAFPKERAVGQRAVVVVDVDRISDSCGFSVPLMDFRGDRDVLDRVQEKRDDAYYEEYWRTTNAESIDGLPAVPAR